MASPLDRLITKIEAEIKELDHEFKVVLPKAIGIAREHGDLSENAEYHAARERHAFVKAQLGQLSERLATLKGIDITKIPRDRVGLYSKVTVFDVDTEEEVKYHLVTSEEAEPDDGLISSSSPLGRGLMGNKVEDEVSIDIPAGTRTFEITELETIHDQEN
ncbi:MAG: transcription elongation factor GreA [Acidobacteriota bacterium]